jgi:hypothetical protein
LKCLYSISLTSNLRTSAAFLKTQTSSVLCFSHRSNKSRKTVKLSPTSSVGSVSQTPLVGRYANSQTPMRPNRPHIPSSITVSKSTDTKTNQAPVSQRSPNRLTSRISRQPSAVATTSRRPPHHRQSFTAPSAFR